MLHEPVVLSHAPRAFSIPKPHPCLAPGSLLGPHVCLMLEMTAPLAAPCSQPQGCRSLPAQRSPRVPVSPAQDKGSAVPQPRAAQSTACWSRAALRPALAKTGGSGGAEASGSSRMAAQPNPGSLHRAEWKQCLCTLFIGRLLSPGLCHPRMAALCHWLGSTVCLAQVRAAAAHPAWQRGRTPCAMQCQEEGMLQQPQGPGALGAAWRRPHSQLAPGKQRLKQPQEHKQCLMGARSYCTPSSALTPAGLCHVPTARSIPGSRGMYLQGWDTVCAEHLHAAWCFQGDWVTHLPQPTTTEPFQP